LQISDDTAYISRNYSDTDDKKVKLLKFCWRWKYFDIKCSWFEVNSTNPEF